MMIFYEYTKFFYEYMKNDDDENINNHREIY